jgi:hypothetical protein
MVVREVMDFVNELGHGVVLVGWFRVVHWGLKGPVGRAPGGELGDHAD